jgi:hypothetical protein
LPLPTQAIFPGLLESAYRRELQNLFSKNVLARLWAKDTSLWPAEDYQAEYMESNLGWLDLPGQLGPLLARVVARAAKIAPAGFERVVFVTMGVSSLAAESILHLPAASLGKRPFLLDTIDPDSLRAFDELLDFDTTLFVFSNKSGKLIETHSLLLYFLERLKMMGIHSPAHHFITLAEENSYWASSPGNTTSLIVFLIPRASMAGFHRSFISIFFSRRSVALIQVTCSRTRNRCAMPAVPRPQGKQTPRYRSVRSWQRRKSRA